MIARQEEIRRGGPVVKSNMVYKSRKDMVYTFHPDNGASEVTENPTG